MFSFLYSLGKELISVLFTNIQRKMKIFSFFWFVPFGGFLCHKGAADSAENISEIFPKRSIQATLLRRDLLYYDTYLC